MLFKLRAAIIVGGLLSVAFAAMPGIAHALAGAGSTTIVVTIQPVRYIVVSKDSGVIDKIISNTPSNITPMMCFQDCSGQLFTPTAAVMKQYQTLLPNLNIHRTGTIYYHAPAKNSLVFNLR